VTVGVDVLLAPGQTTLLDVGGPAVGLETWVAPSENPSSPAVNARGMSAGATESPSDTSTSSNPCTTRPLLGAVDGRRRCREREPYRIADGDGP
jgi:hypothetical protein